MFYVCFLNFPTLALKFCTLDLRFGFLMKEQYTWTNVGQNHEKKIQPN